MRSNAYCGNLLWQSGLTRQAPSGPDAVLHGRRRDVRDPDYHAYMRGEMMDKETIERCINGESTREERTEFVMGIYRVLEDLHVEPAS